mmetsp:Transcript_3190/g.7556  ORF Transcript_3190/g.7556 Transcript_3190/m.7556 type:complete len:407 (+) Transcript_3190:1125-2345(+)
MQPIGCQDSRGGMSGLPIFVDPSATVVYHTVPKASNNGQGLVSGGHSQQPLPSAVTMSVVQNNSPRKHDPISNVPLPPGMEVVLGGKKYKIQYQSYEMTREKASEYIARCTGTPYSRMSAPPDPETYFRTWGAAGTSREGTGELGGRSTTDRMGVKPAAMATPMAGDRGTIRRSSISTATSEDKHQMQKTPDEVYTTMSPVASGLPPPLARGGALPQQHQQQLSTVPEQQVGGHYQVPTYAPAPKDSDQQQENLGYFWEDGVWKVWQADSGKTPASAPGASEASSSMPPPLPIQQGQYSQHTQASYTSQLQTESPQYQYQYQYNYTEQRQQQQQQQQQLQQPTSLASNTHDPSSYAASPYAPHPQQQPPQGRGPPPTGLLQAHGIADSSNASGAGSVDPMLQRYMI